MDFALFVLLLCAHLLGDFLFQTNYIVQHKKRLDVLAIHILIISALTLLAIGQFNGQILAIIALSHFVIDFIKVRFSGAELRWFVADQCLHVAVLIAVSVFIPVDIRQSLLLHSLEPENLRMVLEIGVYAAGLMSCVIVGGHVIKLAVHPFTYEIGNALEGLREGGRIIGQLERFLVFVFTLSGNPAAIGFLIAAKSILRFGDISNPTQRKIAEYVIIGTLMSFAWAVTVSQLTVLAVSYISTG